MVHDAVAVLPRGSLTCCNRSKWRLVVAFHSAGWCSRWLLQSVSSIYFPPQPGWFSRIDNGSRHQSVAGAASVDSPSANIRNRRDETSKALCLLLASRAEGSPASLDRRAPQQKTTIRKFALRIVGISKAKRHKRAPTTQVAAASRAGAAGIWGTIDVPPPTPCS